MSMYYLQRLYDESESLRDKNGKLPKNWSDYYLAINKKTNEGNIFPACIHPQIALDYLRKYLLGEDWYVNDPIATEQVNAAVVNDILYKYSSRYRKELKARWKQQRRANKPVTFWGKLFNRKR